MSHYYINILNLQEHHPSIFEYLTNGGFTASVSGLPFSKIPCDQIMETTINRSSKGTSGLSRKTENIGACEKCMRLNHIMCALREHLDSIIRKRATSKHINYGKKRSLNDEKDVTMLSETLTNWVPNLWTPYQPLVNLVTGKEAPKEMIVNVKSIKQRGEKLMDGFISRFTFNEGSPAQKTYCDTITKQKSYLSLKTSIKMIQLLQERKISLLLKCYHVMRTAL